MKYQEKNKIIVDAIQFKDDGKATTFEGRKVFRDTQGAYIEAGEVGDGYVRNGGYIVTFESGKKQAMTQKEFEDRFEPVGELLPLTPTPTPPPVQPIQHEIAKPAAEQGAPVAVGTEPKPAATPNP